ncbi:MAG: hypothetical protein ACOCXO_05335, partial [Bacteroidota bacterium]
MKTQVKTLTLILTLLIFVFSAQSQETEADTSQIVVPTEIVVDSTKSDSVIAAEGQEAQLAYNAGVDYFAAEKFKNAVSKFSEAIETNPEFAKAY